MARPLAVVSTQQAPVPAGRRVSSRDLEWLVLLGNAHWTGGGVFAALAGGFFEFTLVLSSFAKQQTVFGVALKTSDGTVLASSHILQQPGVRQSVETRWRLVLRADERVHVEVETLGPAAASFGNFTLSAETLHEPAP